jgi:hypothetical protein
VDLKANAQKLQLKLNSELTVSYDVNHGFSVVDFNCNGIQQNFHVGEVWRAPAGHGVAPSTSILQPEHIMDAISFGTQGKLSTATSLMGGKADSIKRDLKVATGHLKGLEQTLLPSDLAKSSSAPTLTGQGNANDKSAKILELAKASKTGNMNERSTKLLELAKTMCADRVQWKHEHAMKNTVREKYPTLAVEKVQRLLAERAENEGYMEEDGKHVGLVMPRPQPLTEWDFYHAPLSLVALSSFQMMEAIRECESNGRLLLVLVTADWATGSVYNSCKHARVVCEAALGQLRALDLDKKVIFGTVELTEAGAIHSSTKWESPLAQYGVQGAPWLLMFSHGQCVTSEKPSCEIFGKGHRALPGADVDGGLGFAARLRNQPTFAKPRVLVVEPSPNEVVKAGSNQFKLQLETQQMLKQANLDFTLALSVSEGSRMASVGEPAYRILLCSSSVGAVAFADIASRIRQRSPDGVCFVCHDGKVLGELDQQFRDLGSLVHCVFQRPLSKSSFDKALRPLPSTRVNYPKCGMTKASIVEMVQRKLTGA